MLCNFLTLLSLTTTTYQQTENFFQTWYFFLTSSVVCFWHMIKLFWINFSLITRRFKRMVHLYNFEKYGDWEFLNFWVIYYFYIFSFSIQRFWYYLFNSEEYGNQDFFPNCLIFNFSHSHFLVLTITVFKAIICSSINNNYYSINYIIPFHWDFY